MTEAEFIRSPLREPDNLRRNYGLSIALNQRKSDYKAGNIHRDEEQGFAGK